MKQAKHLLFAFLLITTVSLQAQVGIGTATPAASAQLDVSSTTKGLLIPRMTSANRTGIVSPATGLAVYDTDLNQFYFYNGSVWTANNTNYWSLLSGNIYNNTGTNVGIGTTTPGDKLEVNGNIRLTGTGSLLAAPSTVGSAYSVTVRAGDPNVPIGGSGGSVNITATNNMPAGGSGYSNLGPSGNVNITSGSGYNTGGGHINITAGQTSCWAQTANSHSDVNIQGGANLVAADAASINVLGGGTVGVGCPTPNAIGGNLILKSGIGTGSGAQGNIQLLNGNVGIGTAAPSSKLEVNGYTKLGSGGTVPAVQMKKLTGTSPSSVGAIVLISHGLDWTKILAVDVLLDPGGSTLVPPRYDNPVLDYSFRVTSTNIEIYNGASATAIFSRPVRILITYEQ